MAGQPVHVEIPAGDTGKAQAFWESLDDQGDEFGLWPNDPSASM